MATAQEERQKTDAAAQQTDQVIKDTSRLLVMMMARLKDKEALSSHTEAALEKGAVSTEITLNGEEVYKSEGLKKAPTVDKMTQEENDIITRAINGESIPGVDLDIKIDGVQVFEMKDGEITKNKFADKTSGLEINLTQKEKPVELDSSAKTEPLETPQNTIDKDATPETQKKTAQAGSGLDAGQIEANARAIVDEVGDNGVFEGENLWIKTNEETTTIFDKEQKVTVFQAEAGKPAFINTVNKAQFDALKDAADTAKSVEADQEAEIAD